jgi:dihydrofolate synthase / folylpolyglutamate synthase
MDFAEALRELDARIPTRMVPDLDRMRALSDLLDHPERTYRSIHITGTNGKSTTATVATSLLRDLGLRVGTYTSPHLHSVRERIRYDGQPISEEDFAEAMTYLEPYLRQVDGLGERVTYFETLTMLAETWFSERVVDVAVVEVGMGGEWDATNLVDGRIAVVTEVAVDHPELGATPVEIAREKVGIVKEGSIVVTGERSDEVLAVIREAAARAGATLRRPEVDFDLDRRLAVGGQVIDVRVGDRRYDELFVPLYGERLAVDVTLGLVAASAFLGDRALDTEIVRASLAEVRVPGRVEVLRRRPLVVADGAHNPDAAASLREAVEESFTWSRLLLVIGMLGDKDVAGVVDVLGPIADVAIVTRSTSPRAAPAEQLAKEISRVAEEPRIAATVEGAVAQAIELAADDDLVLVTGSFTTVAEARAAVLQNV